MIKWDMDIVTDQMVHERCDVVTGMDMTDKMGDELGGTTYVHCVAEELAAIMVLANSLQNPINYEIGLSIKFLKHLTVTATGNMGNVLNLVFVLIATLKDKRIKEVAEVIFKLY